MAMIPALQAFAGKSGVSEPLVRSVSKQVYLKPVFLTASSLLFVVGLPTVIRNPWEVVRLTIVQSGSPLTGGKAVIF